MLGSKKTSEKKEPLSMDPLSVAAVYVFLFVRSLGKSTLFYSSWRRIKQNSLHSYIHNILAQAQAKGLIGVEGEEYWRQNYFFIIKPD
ncbi:MAG: hypothetical protein V1716_02815 [Candidatus Uhrbacteria bacterium]